jgi:soluble lytic murein transglycosylase-like protein
LGIAEFICAAILSMGWANAETACKHMPTVVRAAEKNGINPHILASLIYVESRWQSRARSGANACGLTQIIPRFTKKSKAGYVSCRQLQQNPTLAIERGAQILKTWIKKYGRGSLHTGLCGYNVGYRCRGTKIWKRGHAYARKVIRLAWKLELRTKMKSEEWEATPGCYEYE